MSFFVIYCFNRADIPWIVVTNLSTSCLIVNKSSTSWKQSDGYSSSSKSIKKFDSNSIDIVTDFLSQVKKGTIKKIIISSVVPKLTELCIQRVSQTYSQCIITISYKNVQIPLKVYQPETIGADRLCNITASVNLYPYPAIIIDFGTATTYDVINKKGEFIGGVIAPGIETSAEYLFKKGALLTKTDLKFPSNIIGLDTKENIQSGIMYGAIDQVEGMICRINNETKIKNNIILTGGLSSVLSKHISLKHILDIDLTLKGMLYIDEVNE